jgi:hypothetical protein
MFGLKTKREKELEELLGIYKKNLDAMGARPEYVTVLVPQADNQIQYWQKLAALIADDYILFHLVRMKESIVKAFAMQGKDYPEYFRGKLACLDDLMTDAKNAKRKLDDIKSLERLDKASGQDGT